MQSVDKKGLIGFVFVDRDDLKVVASRFQYERFVDLAGYGLIAIAQSESQRKCHFHTVVALRFDINLACDPEVTLRPSLVIPFQVLPDLFTIHDALLVVLNAIGKKLGFGADVLIESGQDKRGHIIAQAFGAELWRGRTGSHGCSRRR